MDDFSTYYSKAANICSRMEKCSHDIRNTILGWGADDELANKVVKKLIEEKFIDDSRYATSYVKDKFRFNKWGRIKLSYFLRQKGISSENISEALLSIDEDNYYETLAQLLQEKERKTTAKNLYDKKAKLLRFAQSHGFESDLVFQILSTFENKNE
mgnify:CR=1 FL=1